MHFYMVYRDNITLNKKQTALLPTKVPHFCINARTHKHYINIQYV